MIQVSKSTSFWDRVISIPFAISAMLVLFTMAVTAFEVAVRYFFKIPMAESFEIVEYSLAWMGFLGAAWVLRNEGHTRMDLVLMRLSPRVQAGLNAVTSIVCAALWLLLVCYGLKVTRDYYQSHYSPPTLLAPPMWPIIFIIPLGGFLLFVQFVRRARRYARLWRAHRGKEIEADLESREELMAY